LAVCPNNTEVRIYAKDGSGDWIQEDSLNEVWSAPSCDMLVLCCCASADRDVWRYQTTRGGDGLYNWHCIVWSESHAVGGVTNHRWQSNHTCCCDGWGLSHLLLLNSTTRLSLVSTGHPRPTVLSLAAKTETPMCGPSPTVSGSQCL
jgi:hypothetical protein